MLLDSEGEKSYVSFLRIRYSSRWESQQHCKQLEQIRAERPQLNKRPITNIFIRIICIAENICNFVFIPHCLNACSITF
jgi:hypothetical protein